MQSNNPEDHLSEQSFEDESEDEYEEIKASGSQAGGETNIDDMDFEEIVEEKKPKISERRLHTLNDWIRISKYGKIVEGTNFLPMKTPMTRRRWTDHTKKEDKFTLIDLIKEINSQGKKVAAVIDLNYSDGGYYSWEWLLRKNKELLSSIDYRKIKLMPKELPSKDKLNKVYDVLNKNVFKKDQVVLIHCTKGINRTGHAICYFLCKRFEMKPDVALKKFAEARGYPVCTKELLDDLEDRFA